MIRRTIQRIVLCTWPGVVLLLSSCQPAGHAGHPAKRITVAIRYDDFGNDTSVEMEAKILRGFEERGIRVTYGVIPFPCAGDIHDPSPRSASALTRRRADVLISGVRSGLLEVAQHGYSHQTSDFHPIMDEQFSEFVRRDPNQQRREIAEGKAHLEKSALNDGDHVHSALE